MPRFFRVLMTLLVAVFLTGGQWAMLQSVAWTGMFADYIRNLSLADALEKTFDGEEPCPMCCAVKEGREQEKKQGEKAVVEGVKIAFALPDAITLRTQSECRGIRLIPPELLPPAAPAPRRALRPPIA